MHPEGPVLRPGGEVDHAVGGTHTPRAVISSLVGELPSPLSEQTAPGAVSHEPGVSRPVVDTRGAGEGLSATQRMICVTVEISEGPVSRRVRVTALSIRRALALAGGGRPGRKARLVFPIDPEAFFASGDLPRQAPSVAESPELYAHVLGCAVTGSARGTIGGDSPRSQGEEQPPSDEAGPLLGEHNGATEVVVMTGTKPTRDGQRGVRVASTGR